MSVVVFIIVSITVVVVPLFVMGLLAPELARRAPRQHNYRGREVWHGLALVWVIWILGIWASRTLSSLLLGYQSSWLSAGSLALPLVIGSCFFGLFDDFLGSASPQKGFRGHLGALLEGRMTTGFLKLLGIGVLSLFTAALLTHSSYPHVQFFAELFLRAAVIALSANLMNLMDLRPGRALKAYSACLTVLSVVFLLLCMILTLNRELLYLLLISYVPVLAVWRFDISEQGMLGDAGANTMGAYLGFLFSLCLPIPYLLVVFLIVLVLNLASERYSFSETIEKNSVLKKIDDWGRKL